MKVSEVIPLIESDGWQLIVGQLEIAGLTSFNRVGNAPRVDGEQTRTSLGARGVAHAVKRRKGAIQSFSTTGGDARKSPTRQVPTKPGKVTIAGKQGDRLFQCRVGPTRFERRPTIRKHREFMVGRRGEAPLVPPYRLHRPNKAMALAGKPSVNVPPGTLNSILKQAGLK